MKKIKNNIQMFSYSKTTWVNGQTPINATNLNHIEDGIANVWDAIYPVGSIYLSVNNTNPSTLFGGTWEQIEGRYLLGAGTPTQNTNTNHGSLTNDQLSWSWTAGQTLGEYKHILTTNEMPSHTHGEKFGQYPVVDNKSALTGYENPERTITFNVNDTTSTPQQTSSVGGGQAHNIIPASLVVYMWKRTA